MNREIHTPPTAYEIRIATSVLDRLRKRIDKEAATRVMHLPDSTFGDRQAAQLEARTLQQSGRIEAVIAQLNEWSETIRQSHGIRV